VLYLTKKNTIPLEESGG